jgi:nitrite reductase/ring-hydroxylating ferredoxin subunit
LKNTPSQAAPGAALVPLCELGALDEEEVEMVQIEGQPPLAVYNLGGQYFVTADTCSHGSASLADGLVTDGEIECPYHGGRFNIRTGEATLPPCSEPIDVYPTEVTNGWVCARLVPATPASEE